MITTTPSSSSSSAAAATNDNRHAATWGWGVLLTTLGQFVATVGLLAMKRASQQEAHAPWFRRKYFWLGLGCVLLNGCAIDVVAFSLAPLSLIAPFASLSIVYSAILAHYGILVNREGVSRRATGAMAVVICGIVFASAFGPHDSRPHNVHELGRDAVQPRFLVFAMFGLACIVSYLLWGRTRVPDGSSKKLIWCALASSICAALSQVGLKCISEALAVTFAGDTQLIYFGFYVPVLAIAIFAPLNVRLLEETLSQGRATFAIPVYQSILVTTTILAGGAFFGEFETLPNTGYLIGFLIGIAAACAGLRLLSTEDTVDDEEGVFAKVVDEGTEGEIRGDGHNLP